MADRQRTGRVFMALDPGPIAGPASDTRLARQFSAITDQPNVRLPGQRRAAAHIRTAAAGVDIPVRRRTIPMKRPDNSA